MLIFFYGADSFRSQEKTNQLKERFLKTDNSGSGLSCVDFDEKATLRDLTEALSSGGLFSTKRFVIVRNCIASVPLDMQKEIISLLKKHSTLVDDRDLVVLFWEQSEPKKNNALFTYLSKTAKKELFAPLSGASLNKWISERIVFHNDKLSIEPKAMQMLAALGGADLVRLDNEIAKLSQYVNDVIKKEDVELLVRSEEDATIFETVEALTGGNKKRALELFHGQLSKGEDAYYILSMYVYQVRNLLKIADCVERGNTNHFNIAKETKLHPFVVQKSLPHVRKLSLAKLKQMFSSLADIDHAAKTGKVDLILALDMFISSI